MIPAATPARTCSAEATAIQHFSVRILRSSLPPQRSSASGCQNMSAGRGLDRQPNGCLLWRMDEDAVFHALADASRRALLDRLRARNGQTLAELCEGLAMTRQA